jgi:Acetyltransferase (GNAT) family
MAPFPEDKYFQAVATSDQANSDAAGADPFSSDKADLKYSDLSGLLDRLRVWAADPDPSALLLPSNLKILSQSRLVNLINFRNFLGKEIFLVFSHPRFNKTHFLPVNPAPGTEDDLVCTWPEGSNFREGLGPFRLACLLFEEGCSCVIAPAEEIQFEDKGMIIRLPQVGFEILSRKGRRYPCRPITASLMQDGFVCQGLMDEFSINTFRVAIPEMELAPWNRINPRKPLNIILKTRFDEIVYSGWVQVLKERDRQRERLVIFSPEVSGFQRIKNRETRTERFKLTPSPYVVFQHPLIQKTVKLPIRDVSITGFSSEAQEEESANLLPGLIIKEMNIEFPDQSALPCQGQIVYQLRVSDSRIQYGFFILEMSSVDHLKLSNLLNRILNQNVELNGLIDAESLWSLFFRSGFIYPQKYKQLANKKDHLQEVYSNISFNNPEIARHFIYQDRGEIQGHIGMLRVYEKTWMIHHYAADPEFRHKKVGLTLLHQLHRYIIDSINLTTTRLQYIICYFQPQNKFSNLVFGGAARKIRNPSAVSLDKLAYLNFPGYLRQEELPWPWRIETATLNDLEELSGFYKMLSGGLMLDAMDLNSVAAEPDRLNEHYARAGLNRQRQVLAVRKGATLRAVISLTMTNPGLNLSELTNAATLIILEPKSFPYDIFLRVLSWLGRHFPMEQMPVMVFPEEYTRDNNLPCERVYNLWVSNLDWVELYARYIKDVFFKVKLF